jgi:hypothetical protein
VLFLEATGMNRFRSHFKDSVQLLMQAHLGGFICLILATGCSDKAGAPVNINVAQKILESAMKSWQDGKSSKDLLAGTPSVFVQEAEWNEETKLVGYEIISNDQPAGPNLIATVKLKLSKPDGKVTEKTATYVVGTSPSFTIYRNLMK